MKLHIPLLASLPFTYAWGTLGHQTVAYIASSFVQPSTEAYFQTLLYNTSSSYLANIATWADSYRYTAAGNFTAPFHFIDAEDDPPSSCGVKYERDCGAEGCIVGAILNYTTRVLDTTLPFWQRNMAAKFIVHFLGDIHQPLHDESIDRGGNSILVNFSGISTNLHHVWDTNIPETLIGGYGLSYAESWAGNLTVALNSGVYAGLKESWMDGMDLADPVTSSLIWAGESNQFVCTTVLPDGKDGIEGKELNGTYFDDAVPVVQLQIAKAGYRLAKWLDLIADAITPAQEEL